MSNRTENIETALIGRDLQVIVKDLLGVSTSALPDGDVVASYGQTPGGAADTTAGGIILDSAVRYNGGTGETVEIIMREMIATSGTLQKAALDVYIFDEYALALASNEVFALDGTTTAKKIKAVLPIAEADWKNIDALNAIATVTYSRSIKAALDTTAMKAVVVMRSTSRTYSADHTLQMELQIHRD